MSPSDHPIQPISAGAFKASLPEADAVREVVIDHFRELTRAALDGDAKGWKDRVLELLAQIQADHLIARASSRPEIVSPSGVRQLLRAARLEEGATRVAPSLGAELVGRGWHAAERQPDGTIQRWSGPGPLTSIFIPRLMDGQYLVWGKVIFLAPNAADEFSLRLSGNFERPVLNVEVDEVRQFEISLPVAETGRSNFTRLEFHCGKRGRPVDIMPGNLDSRVLGFKLLSLSVEKVG